MDPDDTPVAEHLDVPVRLIVAPADGIFRSAAADEVPVRGEIVQAGKDIGSIERNVGSVTVTSPHTALLMGLLALSGERVRVSQALAWVRTIE